MMLALAVTSFIGGAIQSITGFGAGIILVVVLTNYVSVIEAPAIETTICLVLSITLAWKFRKFLNIRKCALPGAAYLLVSSQALLLAKNADMIFLARCLGVFLILVSIYFFLFEKKIHIRPTTMTAIICGMSSGFFSGLFGIGGPPLGLYMINVTEDHREYIANTQFCFSLVCISNTIIRVSRGIYTAEMIPFTIVGLTCVCLGTLLGARILRTLSKDLTKKLIYTFVGLSGVVTLLQNV